MRLPGLFFATPLFGIWRWTPGRTGPFGRWSRSRADFPCRVENSTIGGALAPSIPAAGARQAPTHTKTEIHRDAIRDMHASIRSNRERKELSIA